MIPGLESMDTASDLPASSRTVDVKAVKKSLDSID